MNPCSAVPSTEAPSQRHIFFYSEVKLHTCKVDDLGTHFYRLELTDGKCDSVTVAVGCPSERPSTINISSQISVGRSDVSSSLLTPICKSPGFRLCSTLITDPRIGDYGTKKQRKDQELT